MLRRPDVDEVKAYGEALGLDLTSTEARIMHSRMMATVDALDAFNELRVEEHRPPLRFTDRDPGYRPTEHEDPLNVFLRKCRVAGADHGPLPGAGSWASCPRTASCPTPACSAWSRPSTTWGPWPEPWRMWRRRSRASPGATGTTRARLTFPRASPRTPTPCPAASADSGSG